jgi:phosphoglycolate phosphatase
MPTIRGVVFDLDGTLLDTLQDLADAVNRVMRLCGFPEHDSAAIASFVGDGAEALIRRALPAAERTEKQVAACLKAFIQDYGENLGHHTRPYAGIPMMLDAIQSAGIKMAVFSNKPHSFTEQCVERFLGNWLFVTVVGHSSRFPKKPDPTGALAIAACLQEDPARILYVGDTATDMQTALAAGMIPLGVGWGFRPAAELVAAGCRFLAQQPADVMAFLAIENRT